MSEELRYEHAERVRDFYREQGAEREQQRIIKLLENDQCRPDQRFHFAPCACKYIALIKGESK